LDFMREMKPSGTPFSFIWRQRQSFVSPISLLLLLSCQLILMNSPTRSWEDVFSEMVGIV
jgi:hypothetical protein